MRRAAIPLLLAIAFSASAAATETINSRIPRSRVSSSALVAVGYSRRLHALEVEFVNGAVYRYLDVPAQIYRDLISAASKARFYDENVRGHFRSVHVKAWQSED
ncbi:MAG: hypothetical protein QOH24_361 [Verrucomicrobiota bacterium]